MAEHGVGPVGFLEALDELIIELDRDGLDELFELRDLGAADDGSVHAGTESAQASAT